VITIHPAFCAFDRLRRTAATTPSPKRIKIAVPIISDVKSPIAHPFPLVIAATGLPSLERTGNKKPPTERSQGRRAVGAV
jgi:hypothetical protein